MRKQRTGMATNSCTLPFCCNTDLTCSKKIIIILSKEVQFVATSCPDYIISIIYHISLRVETKKNVMKFAWKNYILREPAFGIVFEPKAGSRKMKFFHAICPTFLSSYE